MILSRFEGIFDEYITSKNELRIAWSFPNGYGASLAHTLGRNELAVLHGGRVCYDTPVVSDIVVHVTRQEVETLLELIQLLEEGTK